MSSAPSGSPSSSSSGGTTWATAVIAVGVVIGVVIIVVVRATLRWQKRKLRALRSLARRETSNPASPLTPAVSNETRIELEPIEQFLDDLLQEKPKRFSAEQLREFTKNYSQKLGAGGFAVVYKGWFPNGVQVAVKVLKETMNEKAEEQFMAEVGTIGRTYHINLVKLYGFCFDRSMKALIYEFVENGSLDKYLFDQAHEIEWARLYEIALGTARGIRYLHEECQQKIVHYDIKPTNVLLTANFSPKVADFGLAKSRDRERSQVTISGGLRGTPGYAAPEMWMQMPVTHKCDVYSFGMPLLELLGRRRNLDPAGAESQLWFPMWVWRKYEKSDVESILSHCGIDGENKAKAERMCLVALWCIQQRPEARPSMSRDLRMLEGEVDVEPPENPFQYIALDSANSPWSTRRSTDSSREMSPQKKDGREMRNSSSPS